MATCYFVEILLSLIEILATCDSSILLIVNNTMYCKAFSRSYIVPFILSFQLANFLYQYIKKRELWDPYQPTVIHCEKDPLGRVFGVKTFTHAEALNLLLKNTFPVNSRKRRYTENERVFFTVMLAYSLKGAWIKTSNCKCTKVHWVSFTTSNLRKIYPMEGRVCNDV